MTADITQLTPARYKTSNPDEQVRLAMAAGKIGTWECNLEPGTDANAAVGASNSKGPATGALPQADACAPLRNPSFGGPKIRLSAELQSILGLGQAGFDGTLATLLARIYPADRSAVLKAFKKAIRAGTDPELEIRFSRPGHPPGWLLVRGRLYGDTEDRPEQLLGVAVDISARKAAELDSAKAQTQLERKLAARTRQLRATNDELDAFCYSVSHDLRAPLRSIRGFNEVLLERYGAKLDARGQEFLRRACDSCYSMDRLIDDLLKLSRAGRAELACRPVELSQLASAIAEALLASAPDRRASFQIAPGVRAFGDERLLRIVLENLLGNAWKFTCKRPEAHIEFGFAPAPARAFFVRDNGAGFDPAYAGRLFGAFQRLHSDSEFAGTGVGLATVQRIVNHHGGRVWAEGAVEGGATFYFSLPDDESI